jgi:uncharacterized repeat protein (TIGR03803 family)
MREYVSSTVNLRGLSICAVVLFVSSVLAAAQHGRLIHTFAVSPGDGSGPFGGLIADAAGNLYGTTGNGGAVCCGTVYELSPPASPSGAWTETVLYSFTDGADGGSPIGNLVFDTMGNLYGTAQVGGNPSCFTGCGAVFELSPPAVQGGGWTETTLYSFAGGSDGANPYGGGLVLDQTGNLYGTTALGGGVGSCGASPGCGTVFELSPPAAPGGPWTETVLYSFTGGSDGGAPFAPVVFDKVGNLYGTTSGGGTSGYYCNDDLFLTCGTVFELSPSGEKTWTETVLHSFSPLDGDGFQPEFGGLLMGESGALAGTTSEGGAFGFGTVFGLLPPSRPGGKWSYGVLYSFGASQNDGVGPEAGVISADGVLYGTTTGGGLNGVGAVFQLGSTVGGVWKETGLFSYANGAIGGAHPLGGMIILREALYGTTSDGGRGNGGTVFSVVR